MAIVIKEIKVRTTIERAVLQSSVDDRKLSRLRSEIMREVREVVRKEMNHKQER